jgi:hypothetical protein
MEKYCARSIIQYLILSYGHEGGLQEIHSLFSRYLAVYYHHNHIYYCGFVYSLNPRISLPLITKGFIKKLT